MSPLLLPVERQAGSRWPSYKESKDLPVLVVTMRGSHYFDDLDSAKRKFPSLDPWKNGKKFTWAMKDRQRGRQVMRFEDWEVERSMSMSASDKTAGMAQIRKMVRVKANITVNKVVEEEDDLYPDKEPGYVYTISGRLWLDLGSVAAEPFRFKATVTEDVDVFGGQPVVRNFRPLQGAVSGAAAGLTTFYAKALSELIQENPRLIKG